nr:P-II family nitrogen regulator [Anaerovibrio sp. JC8]
MMKMTKIEIITRSNKLDDLMGALNDIGVLGMTVSQVFGCGLQKGHEEVYRGKKYDINLVPKVKIETVVCEVPVDLVLDTAQRVLRTGNYGDGKIFVYELTDAVRIRTGQRGATAIMDIPGEKKESSKS